MNGVVARQAIHDLLVRYALGLDRVDEEILMSVFWPDSQCDYGTFRGSGPAFVRYAIPTAGSVFSMTTHAVSNVLIEFESPTIARSQAYFDAFHEYSSGGRVIVAGRYIDRHEARGDEWRIAHRLEVIDWHSGAQSEDDFPVSASLKVHGGRKPDDAWYK